MATNVIMPALGMAQETGLIVRWLKAAGETVKKGEPLLEIETDKATVEIEASAAGVLANVTAAAGDEIPVGQVIAQILATGEAPESTRTQPAITTLAGNENGAAAITVISAHPAQEDAAAVSDNNSIGRNIAATPLASRIAAEHNLDLHKIKPSGRRIQKADVLTYIGDREKAVTAVGNTGARLSAASPKARRLAREQQKDLAAISGSGPDGAVLAADVLNAQVTAPAASIASVAPVAPVPALTPLAVEAGEKTMTIGAEEGQELAVSHSWRIMAERITQSWTSVPHFYLVREVRADRLIAWREAVQKRSGEKVTYTDLLVKVVATALRQHSRLNAAWHAGRIMLNEEINVGLAVATGTGSGQGSREGLVVPVIPHADRLGVGEIVYYRQTLVAKAQEGKLRPEDISGGTFTISNLGMYGVDAFNAVINPPQVAILAVGRIAERVIPVDGHPSVQPVMVLTLSCDHRVVDGARGAQFLATLAEMLEEPLALLG